VGKVPVDVSEFHVDLLSISAHKMYGPKGVGALFIRGGSRSFPIRPLMLGGGQEANVRSGTSNVPAIVGFGEASRIAAELLPQESQRLRTLRDSLETELRMRIPKMGINGYHTLRLPNTSSLTFPGVDADALLLNMPMIMAGTGTACHSGTLEPSHVLEAIGLSRQDANSTIRLSLGRFFSEDQLSQVCNAISDAYSQFSS
jgi:cysteine desulfurase